MKLEYARKNMVAPCCPVLPLSVFHSPAAAVCELAAHRRQKKRVSWPAAKMQVIDHGQVIVVIFDSNFYPQNSLGLQQTLVIKHRRLCA
jgi:hypothetical protein